MNEWDIYYKAFKEFRKITHSDSHLNTSRKTLVTNNSELTSIKATKLKVKIIEDWILEIESKMVYIEKAVKEERQFIQSNGEVVPIEKVKKVSRESVTHLAKHSNLITKIPEDSLDIIPEKLYMVEKNNDYTVYENRFLYFVLIFLKEFIQERLDAINKALFTYKGKLKLNKDLKLKNDILKFNLDLEEENYENPYYSLTPEESEVLSRINSIRFSVDMLLETPLMIEVSKAPLISLPIVKTNPIKMNNNFKKTLELFEFVNSYNTLGYEIKEEVLELNPPNDEISDELCEIVKLSSFLTFQYGQNITDKLKNEYELGLEKLRQKEREELDIKIKNLKKRIELEKISPYEYMLLLEKQNRDLEKDSLELASVKEKVIELTKINDELSTNVKALNNVIIKKDKEIEAWAIKYDTDISNLKKLHLEEIESINLEHENSILKLNEINQKKVDDLINKYDDEIDLINQKHDKELSDFKVLYSKKIEDAKAEERLIMSKQINSLNEMMNNLNEELTLTISNKDELINDYRNSLDKLNNDYDELLETKKELDGLYLAARIKNNEILDPLDYRKQENFIYLDEAKKALDNLYNKSWQEAKKLIRKEKLWDRIKELLKKKK